MDPPPVVAIVSCPPLLRRCHRHCRPFPPPPPSHPVHPLPLNVDVSVASRKQEDFTAHLGGGDFEDEDALYLGQWTRGTSGRTTVPWEAASSVCGRVVASPFPPRSLRRQEARRRLPDQGPRQTPRRALHSQDGGHRHLRGTRAGVCQCDGRCV